MAAFLGNLRRANVRLLNLPLANSYEAAYGRYVGNSLTKLAVINLRQYNYTVNGTSLVPNPVLRPTLTYNFTLPPGIKGTVELQRLWANGSDAVTGITFDGLSYNYELKKGLPVRQRNVTRDEKLKIVDGIVSVSVPDSSAVILNFET